MEKKSSLKKFLATASAFAVLIGGAQSAAAAAALNVLADAPDLDIGYGLAGGQLSANFANGDDLTLNGGDWNITTAADVTINGIANGGRVGTFTTGNISTFTGAIAAGIDVFTTAGGIITGGQDIGGLLLIDSGGVLQNTINDAANAVTLTSGKLTMNNLEAM